MLHVWVAGVIPRLTQAESEHFRDEVLYNKALYKSTLLYFTSILCVNILLTGSMTFTSRRNYPILVHAFILYCFIVYCVLFF